MRKLIIGVCLLGCCAVVKSASQVNSNRASTAPVVTWQGNRPVCPAGYQPAASEQEYRESPETATAHCER